MHGIISISYTCWGLFCALRYDQFWRKFHGLLRRVYIVWKLDEIFCIHQLGPFELQCDLVLGFLCRFFVWITYLLVIGGIKSPITTMLESMHAFKSFRVCLMKLGALTLGAYRLIIISFWCTSLLLRWSILLYLIWSIKVWMSTLYKISIATPACFQRPLSW
jgi:hypothetical protein